MTADYTFQVHMEHSLKYYVLSITGLWILLIYNIFEITCSMFSEHKKYKVKLFNSEKEISLHIYKNPQIEKNHKEN